MLLNPVEFTNFYFEISPDQTQINITVWYIWNNIIYPNG